MAFLIYGYVKRQPAGNEMMIDLAEQIHDGAMAFLKREYTFLFFFVIVVAVLLGFAISLHTSIAYISGALSSIIAGFLGMKAATRANVRTSAAANEFGAGKALRIAFFGGAVMGLAVASLGLFGLGVFYFIFAADAVPGTNDLPNFSEIIAGFAMGASSIALFARVGGGIYTKAADVGADLVGKVEAGIPEDDPRNPATIADNVGDNVGDVAGLGADIFESYVGSIVATMAIAATSATMATTSLEAVALPILTVAVGPGGVPHRDLHDEGPGKDGSSRRPPERDLHRRRDLPGGHVVRGSGRGSGDRGRRNREHAARPPAPSGPSWPGAWWGSSSGW